MPTVGHPSVSMHTYIHTYTFAFQIIHKCAQAQNIKHVNKPTRHWKLVHSQTKSLAYIIHTCQKKHIKLLKGNTDCSKYTYNS